MAITCFSKLFNAMCKCGTSKTKTATELEDSSASNIETKNPENSLETDSKPSKPSESDLIESPEKVDASSIKGTNKTTSSMVSKEPKKSVFTKSKTDKKSRSKNKKQIVIKQPRSRSTNIFKSGSYSGLQTHHRNDEVPKENQFFNPDTGIDMCNKLLYNNIFDGIENPNAGDHDKPCNEGDRDKPCNEGDYDKPFNEGDRDNPCNEGDHDKPFNEGVYDKPCNGHDHDQPSNEESAKDTFSNNNENDKKEECTDVIEDEIKPNNEDIEKFENENVGIESNSKESSIVVEDNYEETDESDSTDTFNSPVCSERSSSPDSSERSSSPETPGRTPSPDTPERSESPESIVIEYEVDSYDTYYDANE